MEHRVSQLEGTVRMLVELREETREDLGRIFAKLEAMQADIARYNPCPQPGLCLRLEDGIEDVKRDVRVLEAARNRALGERAIAGGVAGLVGAGLVAIFTWLLGKLGN